MDAEKLETMTADELGRYMVVETAENGLSREEYMALYGVYCAKRKAEASGENPGLSRA